MKPRIGQAQTELSTTFAVGEEAEMKITAGARQAKLRPLPRRLNRVQPAVRRGDTVRVDVVVRTRKVGHFFPGGTVDAYDTWLELKGTDDKGQTIFWSGKVEDDGKGPVEKGAHFYRSLQIDEHGNPINKRNAWATRAVVYVRLIPPGAADTVHYRLHVPENAGKQDHAARPALLSQVRLVEHAVLVRRSSRSRASRRGGHARLRRSHSSRSTAPLTGVSAKDEEDSRPARSWRWRRTKSRCNVAPHECACSRSRRPSCKQKTGSAGTITASACSCKAI